MAAPASHKKHREQVRVSMSWKTGPSAKKCPICTSAQDRAQMEAEKATKKAKKARLV